MKIQGFDCTTKHATPLATNQLTTVTTGGQLLDPVGFNHAGQQVAVGRVDHGRRDAGGRDGTVAGWMSLGWVVGKGVRTQAMTRAYCGWSSSRARQCEPTKPLAPAIKADLPVIRFANHLYRGNSEYGGPASARERPIHRQLRPSRSGYHPPAHSHGLFWQWWERRQSH